MEVHDKIKAGHKGTKALRRTKPLCFFVTLCLCGKKSQLILILLIFISGCSSQQKNIKQSTSFISIITETLQQQILKEAEWAMQQEPVTVTAQSSPRSAGGIHDFFSEGDYWWPDTKDPNAPYVQRDGMTNPDNFVAHRHAMIRFSRHLGALTSAWRITGEVKYADA